MKPGNSSRSLKYYVQNRHLFDFDFDFVSNTWNLQFFDPEKFPIPETASSFGHKLTNLFHLLLPGWWWGYETLLDC
jgi:hypothetical protein